MLLTISTSHDPATDLGFLLHKHPDRCQTFALSFGKAHVFYPEANDHRCVACLLLDVDSVGLVRGKGDWKNGLLDQYVNDRPFVASSLMSVAISQVFGSAMAGRSKERAELVKTAIPLAARLDVLPVRGGEELLQRVFEPLGYEVTSTQHPLDEVFPEWGESPYFSVQKYDLFKQWATVKRGEFEDRLADRYILFGEWVYAKHSVHYRQLEHYFFEFDIYDKQEDTFISLERRVRLLDGSGVRTVPVIHTGPIAREQLAGLIGPSRYDSQFDNLFTKRTDNLMEGLYLRTEDNGAVTGRLSTSARSLLRNQAKYTLATPGNGAKPARSRS